MARPDSGRPGPHHDPPADFDAFELPLLETDRPWLRFHSARRDALFFGKTGRHRFDDPAAAFGVLYAAEDAFCAFVETFGHATGTVDLVTRSALAERGLTRIEPRRPLRLVDLKGSGLARLRADARLTSGSVDVARRWSAACHNHPVRPDGLVYRARHDPERLSAAVFERARNALVATPLGGLLDPDNLRLLAEILDVYDFGLVDA